MKPSMLEAALELARMGALHSPVAVSSRDLGRALGCSQQTASARLIEMERGGLLERRAGASGQRVRLTEQARRLLWERYQAYRCVFERDSDPSVEGVIASGLGEGKYYVAVPGYRDQFRRLLGFEPFPGTLNVVVGPEFRAAMDELLAQPGIALSPFTSEGRTFGSGRCVPVLIGDRSAYAVVPDRTHHANTLELIAPVNLRKALGLADGDRVAVRFRRGGEG